MLRWTFILKVIDSDGEFELSMTHYNGVESSPVTIVANLKRHLSTFKPRLTLCPPSQLCEDFNKLQQYTNSLLKITQNTLSSNYVFVLSVF